MAPQTFAASSTLDSIDHLHQVYQIEPDSPVLAGPTSSQISILSAFGQIIAEVEFNTDVFHSMLIHWITAAGVPFLVWKHPAFATLLANLAPCQPDLKAIMKLIPKSGHTLRH